MDNITSNINIKQNPKFLINIVKNIEKKIKRFITTVEENLVIKAINSIQDKYFEQYTTEDITNIIENLVIEEITINHCEINDVNIHEILKSEINPDIERINLLKKEEEEKDVVDTNIESIFGYNNIATLVKKINEPVSSINNAYLLLDSKYRNLNNDGTEYFSWDHINQLVTAQGTVNSLGNIRDIISVVLMPIKIPNVIDANNDYDLVTISIEEFKAQSVIAHENRRYHYLSCINRSKSDKNWLSLCVKDYYDGEYKFNTPITTLNTITLKFGSPLTTIKFDKDRLPGKLIYGLLTTIEFNEDHKLVENDLIYIDNFTTHNTAADYNTINAINNIKGNPATIITSTSIQIPIDTSNIQSKSIAVYIVFFGSKRIFIPMELKYLSS